MSRKKKSRHIAIVFLLTLLVAVAAFLGVVNKSIKKQIATISSIKEKEEKKDKKQKQDKDTTLEASAEASGEAAKQENWFAQKNVLTPTVTDATIHLPKADLSVFDVAEQNEGLNENEEAVGPWEHVNLSLEPVAGSINLTSPGEPRKTAQMTSTFMTLIDCDTGEIIAERDSDRQVSPASMTKILTVITARDFIDETKLDDTFVMTDEIIAATQSAGLSAVGFKAGDTVTVRDLLYGTIVCSGADAAYGLAEYCAGSQEAFVAQMNENVEKFGLSDTAHFTNVVGLYDENLYCTMNDMAVILSVAIQDELLLDVLSTRIYHTDKKYPELEMPQGIEISNWFLRRIEDKEVAGAVIGAKTGFVNESMFCAASYYEANNGRRYICATANSNSSWRAIYDHVSVYRSLTSQ